MAKHFPSPVTTIFARRVRPGFERQYEEWLAGITDVSSRFAGNQGTTILRPGAERAQYIAIVQFDSAANLGCWMDSPERAAWCAKLDAITLDSEEVSTLTGMERWSVSARSGAGFVAGPSDRFLAHRPAHARIAGRLGRADGLGRHAPLDAALLRLALSESEKQGASGR
jgi:heme-degrading monooxygenase HmoA